MLALSQHLFPVVACFNLLLSFTKIHNGQISHPESTTSTFTLSALHKGKIYYIPYFNSDLWGNIFMKERMIVHNSIIRPILREFLG